MDPKTAAADPEAVRAAWGRMKEFGTYMPGAWGTNSLVEMEKFRADLALVQAAAEELQEAFARAREDWSLQGGELLLERYARIRAEAIAADAGARARVEEEEDAIAAAHFCEQVSSLFMELEGGEMEFDSFTEIAVTCGLLVTVPYDPDTHGEAFGEPEPGDPIFWPTDRAKRIAARGRALLGSEGRRDE